MNNILHVVSVYFSIPYFLGDQFSFMNNKGYVVYLICSPSNQLSEYSQKHKFSYMEIPILRKISIKADLKAIQAIKKYIKKNNIKIVTGHTPKGAFVSMIAAFLAKVPKRIYFRHGLVYETAHGVKRFILKNIDRVTARLATHIINVSPSIQNKSITDNLNPPHKNRILSKGTCNGINVNKFNRNRINTNKQIDLKKEYHINENDIVIGFCGRLVKDKGITELVEAFETLQQQYNNVKLFLVGMLDERDALPNSIFHSINSNNKIIVTDYVDYDTIELYYSIMDIFVLPSYREGFPTSILEASSMGIPVVASTCTGCIDAVINGKTGIHVDISPKEISAVLKKLIANKELRNQLGYNGIRFVNENFRQEVIWKEIEKIYNE